MARRVRDWTCLSQRGFEALNGMPPGTAFELVVCGTPLPFRDSGLRVTATLEATDALVAGADAVLDAVFASGQVSE